MENFPIVHHLKEPEQLDNCCKMNFLKQNFIGIRGLNVNEFGHVIIKLAKYVSVCETVPIKCVYKISISS